MIWWKKRYKLYSDIHALPLERFIRCICKSDLSALVISGKPSQEELSSCWTNLWYQYIDLNEDNDSLHILLLQRQIAVLDSEIKIVECLTTLLSLCYKPAFVSELRSLGITCQIPTSSDDPAYEGALKSVLATLAPKKLRLDELVAELKSQEMTADGQTVDEKYFDRMLMRLSKFQGYQVRAQNISVAEFVALIEDYLQFVNRKQKKFD